MNGGRSGHTGGTLLNLKYVGAVLEGAAELSSIDCEAQAGVDVGVDDRVLQSWCGVRRIVDCGTCWAARRENLLG